MNDDEIMAEMVGQLHLGDDNYLLTVLSEDEGDRVSILVEDQFMQLVLSMTRIQAHELSVLLVTNPPGDEGEE